MAAHIHARMVYCGDIPDFRWASNAAGWMWQILFPLIVLLAGRDGGQGSDGRRPLSRTDSGLSTISDDPTEKRRGSWHDRLVRRNRKPTPDSSNDTVNQQRSERFGSTTIENDGPSTSSAGRRTSSTTLGNLLKRSNTVSDKASARSNKSAEKQLNKLTKELTLHSKKPDTITVIDQTELISFMLAAEKPSHLLIRAIDRYKWDWNDLENVMRGTLFFESIAGGTFWLRCGGVRYVGHIVHKQPYTFHLVAYARSGANHLLYTLTLVPAQSGQKSQLLVHWNPNNDPALILDRTPKDELRETMPETQEQAPQTPVMDEVPTTTSDVHKSPNFYSAPSNFYRSTESNFSKFPSNPFYYSDTKDQGYGYDSDRRHLALRNSGVDCFINAVLQSFFALPHVRKYFEDYNGENTVFLAIKDVFVNYHQRHDVQEIRSLKHFHGMLQDGQQDATEFMALVMFNPEQPGFNQMFEFEMRRIMQCQEMDCPPSIGGTTRQTFLFLPSTDEDLTLAERIKRETAVETIADFKCEKHPWRNDSQGNISYQMHENRHLIVSLNIFEHVHRKNRMRLPGLDDERHRLFHAWWRLRSAIFRSGSNTNNGHFIMARRDDDLPDKWIVQDGTSSKTCSSLSDMFGDVYVLMFERISEMKEKSHVPAAEKPDSGSFGPSGSGSSGSKRSSSRSTGSAAPFGNTGWGFGSKWSMGFDPRSFSSRSITPGPLSSGGDEHRILPPRAASTKPHLKQEQRISPGSLESSRLAPNPRPVSGADPSHSSKKSSTSSSKPGRSVSNVLSAYDNPPSSTTYRNFYD